MHYERRGDTNHPLTSEEIFELQKNIKKLYFDEMPAFSEERPALISDINQDKINNYLNTIKGINEQNFDAKRFLSNNSYMVNAGQQVKNAAIMIFGKEPQKFIPQLKLSMSIFGGKEITDQFVKKEFVGDIDSIFRSTFIELQRNNKIYSFVVGVQRHDIPEYPIEVIRECLINSIVHRDYFDKNTETFIKLFTDRIEFVNPASFPFENVTFEEIKRTKLSKRRNPLIAEYFESLNLMEKEGRGLSRIEQGMKEHGLLPPIFEANPKTFMVVLKNSENKALIKDSPYKKVVNFELLNDRQLILVKHLQDNNIKYVTRKEYINVLNAHQIQLNSLTATRDLQELADKNVITKIGDKRGTKYVLT